MEVGVTTGALGNGVLLEGGELGGETGGSVKFGAVPSIYSQCTPSKLFGQTHPM
jgi:hypothetical protein